MELGINGDPHAQQPPPEEQERRKKLIRHTLQCELSEKLLIAMAGSPVYRSPSDAWYQAGELLARQESERQLILST